MNKYRQFLGLIFLLIFFSIHAQEKKSIQQRLYTLEILESENADLSKTIDVSVNNIPLNEFIKGVARTHQVNIEASNELNMPLTLSMYKASIKDILAYLISQYDLEVTGVGKIVRISKYVEPIPEKTISVDFDKSNNLLSYDLKGETLAEVFKKITQESGENIVYSPGLESRKLNGYIKSLEFDKAMQQLAFQNTLYVGKNEDGIFLFEDATPIENNGTQTGLRSYRNTKRDYYFEVVDAEKGLIGLDAQNVPLSQIIEAISNELDLDIFYFAPVSGFADVKADEIDIDQLLFKLMQNTNFTFYEKGGIYYIGKKEQESLKNYGNIHLQHRSVEGILEIIPQDISSKLDIKEDVETNSLVVGGASEDANQLKAFLKSIDVNIPVIFIEVMIISVADNYQIDTGISAGIGSAPTNTSGVLYPNYDMTFGANQINRIITGSTFQAVNLGRVNPNLFVRLRAGETNGKVRIKSTPNIATLNGHKANLKIGDKTYYRVERNDYFGSQIPQAFQTINYESVEANLEVEITPVVSADDHITLAIKVGQSRFTGTRIDEQAPPDQTTLEFNSLIRVEDEDVVILGGLEDNNTALSGSGLPLVCRIPILKWILCSQSKRQQKSKLSIFIKPTIFK